MQEGHSIGRGPGGGWVLGGRETLRGACVCGAGGRSGRPAGLATAASMDARAWPDTVRPGSGGRLPPHAVGHVEGRAGRHACRLCQAAPPVAHARQTPPRPPGLDALATAPRNCCRLQIENQNGGTVAVKVRATAARQAQKPRLTHRAPGCRSWAALAQQRARGLRCASAQALALTHARAWVRPAVLTASSCCFYPPCRPTAAWVP